MYLCVNYILKHEPTSLSVYPEGSRDHQGRDSCNFSWRLKTRPARPAHPQRGSQTARGRSPRPLMPGSGTKTWGSCYRLPGGAAPQLPAGRPRAPIPGRQTCFRSLASVSALRREPDRSARHIPAQGGQGEGGPPGRARSGPRSSAAPAAGGRPRPCRAPAARG